MVKDALSYGEIDIFASPWSPPAYMKTNGQMNKGGKLKEEYRELWSEFYVKFIEAYKNEGITISGVTVQNEPKATQTWDSCVYTKEEESDFVKNYLGKKMKDIGVSVMFWDHNKERMIERAEAMLADGENDKYMRSLICSNMGNLGIKLDPVKNNSTEDAVILSTDDSKIKVLKLATNEELVIARDTKNIVSKMEARK